MGCNKGTKSILPYIRLSLIPFQINRNTEQTTVMHKQQITLLYYHVPEDKDDPREPNLFPIPLQQNKIKLAHIHQYFPLQGQYSFRFKFPHNQLLVWLDLSDPQSNIPTFQNQIHIKANRLSWIDPPVNTSKITTAMPLSSSGQKQSINLFDQQEEGLGQGREKEVKIGGGMSLLDNNGESRRVEPTHSSPAIKVDFFGAELTSPGVNDKNLHTSHHSDTGDLI